MPTTHTGDATGLADADPIAVSNPNDGEALTAASNASAPSKLADFIALVKTLFGKLAGNNTWTGTQTLSNAGVTHPIAGHVSIGHTLAVTEGATIESVRLTGTPAAATTPFTDTLTVKNTCKAHGKIEWTGGGPTLVDGFNVASVTTASGQLKVLFGDAMADDDYTVVLTPEGAVDLHGIQGGVLKDPTFFRVEGNHWNGSGFTSINYSAFTGVLYFVVFGAQ